VAAIGLGRYLLKKVNVDAAALRAMVPAAEDLAGRPVRHSPARCLLDGYLRALAGEAAPPPALAPVIGGHLLDLVAAVLGPSRDAAEAIEGGGARAARLRVILREVADHSPDPGFNIDALARAAGISRRYVQGLLEETGKSFTEHVLESRLKRAFTLLTEPRCGHLSIIDVACACGDVSPISTACSAAGTATRHQASVAATPAVGERAPERLRTAADPPYGPRAPARLPRYADRTSSLSHRAAGLPATASVPVSST
jgi:AraC-like DNA-binding protein